MDIRRKKSRRGAKLFSVHQSNWSIQLPYAFKGLGEEDMKILRNMSISLIKGYISSMQETSSKISVFQGRQVPNLPPPPVDGHDLHRYAQNVKID